MNKQNQRNAAHETYSELTIGKTTYCITSVFTGEIDAVKALEDLVITNILMGMEQQSHHKQSAKADH